MQSFIYMGYIVKYEIVDGKIIVSEVSYGTKTIESDMVFGSLREMRNFINLGGWKEFELDSAAI
jgi:hypothetical protein